MTGAQAQWQGQLEHGLNAMGIGLDAGQRQQMLDYLALMLKWNKAFNLTAIRDAGEMVPRQLLDSLSILKLVRGQRVLDVGTGPGLPGVPLAIALPDLHFTLIDSNGKKTRFVQQARAELGLGNLEVVRGRVEEYRPDTPFDTITSRAFASLPKMVRLTEHLLAPRGRILAMKGAVPREELAELEQMGRRVEVAPLFVDQSEGERHAVVLEKMD